MESKIVYTNSKSTEDLKGIISLQTVNHYSNVTKSVAEKEGFVTCIHDIELLTKMNSPYPHIIAKDKNKVVAYALVMTVEQKDALPVLIPMFNRINTLTYKGQKLSNSSYVTMGQICIAKGYRSKGIFKSLYETMAQQLKNHYQFIITEVDAKNERSLVAQNKVGFQTLDVYTSEKKVWRIIIRQIA